MRIDLSSLPNITVRFPPQSSKVPCRSTLTKVICCIPLIGDIAHCIAEKRLQISAKKILVVTPQGVDTAIKHLKTANNLCNAGICRSLISIAILISGLALGVVTVSSASFGLIIEPIFIILFELAIQKNKTRLKQLTQGI